MGYQEGRGLGKEEQGIKAPIEESNQQGKRGLGFAIKNFEKKMEWNPESDPVSAYENPVWLTNNNNDVPSFKELMQWKKIGQVRDQASLLISKYIEINRSSDPYVIYILCIYF